MRRLPLLLLALLVLTGCHQYLPVQAHVYDAQTREPLRGVSVAPVYYTYLDPFPPQQRAKRTDAEGLVALKVCPNYRNWAGVEIETSAYRLDQPLEDTVLSLPRAEVWAKAAAPFRLEVPMVTVEEHRRRYPP